MHIENMHEMIEKLTACTKNAIENNQTHIGQYPIGAVVDMIKDLAEAEYHSKITKAMEKSDEEKEKEYEYALMRMKEEYGEDEGQRYYNDWRYASGRFAPKGRGSRREYDEPPYYHMTPEMYRAYPAEYYRDMDRMNGQMYYTDSKMNGNPSNSMDSVSRTGMNGDTRGYSDGYNDGYSEGRRNNEMSESRYDRAKRGYEETKAMHTGNTQEDKQAKMKELEKYMNELSSDVSSMISDATPEERTLLKAKMQTLITKL